MNRILHRCARVGQPAIEQAAIDTCPRHHQRSAHDQAGVQREPLLDPACRAAAEPVVTLCEQSLGKDAEVEQVESREGHQAAQREEMRAKVDSADFHGSIHEDCLQK